MRALFLTAGCCCCCCRGVQEEEEVVAAPAKPAFGLFGFGRKPQPVEEEEEEEEVRAAAARNEPQLPWLCAFVCRQLGMGCASVLACPALPSCAAPASVHSKSPPSSHSANLTRLETQPRLCLAAAGGGC